MDGGLGKFLFSLEKWPGDETKTLKNWDKLGFSGKSWSSKCQWGFARRTTSLLVGGWPTPLKKYESQLGWWYSQYMEKKCSKPPTRYYILLLYTIIYYYSRIISLDNSWYRVMMFRHPKLWIFWSFRISNMGTLPGEGSIDLVQQWTIPLPSSFLPNDIPTWAFHYSFPKATKTNQKIHRACLWLICGYKGKPTNLFCSAKMSPD